VSIHKTSAAGLEAEYVGQKKGPLAIISEAAFSGGGGNLASVAQFETEIRKERQSAGIAAKRAENDGKCPWGGRRAGMRITLTEEKEALARKLKKEGESVASIARNLGIARKTVYVALGREKE
jgi:DNA invertase Pin-like site-specific DNA recombinase